MRLVVSSLLAFMAVAGAADTAPAPAAAPPAALPCALPYTPPAGVTQPAGGDAGMAPAASPAPSLSWRRLGPTAAADDAPPTDEGWAAPARTKAEHKHLAALAAIAFDDWLQREGDTTACGPANVPAVGVTLTAACVKNDQGHSSDGDDGRGGAEPPRAHYSLEFRARFVCGALAPSDVAVTALLRAVISAAPLSVANSDTPHAAPTVERVWVAGGWQDSARLVASTTRKALLPGDAQSLSAAPPAPAEETVYSGAVAAAAAEERAEEAAAAAAADQQRQAALVAEGLALTAALSQAMAQQQQAVMALDGGASASVPPSSSSPAGEVEAVTVERGRDVRAPPSSAAASDAFRAADLGLNWAVQEGAADLSMPSAAAPAETVAAAGEARPSSAEGVGEADAAPTDSQPSASSPEQEAPSEGGEADAATQQPAEQAAAVEGQDPSATTGDGAPTAAGEEWTYQPPAGADPAAQKAADIMAAGDTAALLAADNTVIDAAVASSLQAGGGGSDDLTDAELWAIGIDPADRTRFYNQKADKPTE